VSVRCGVDLIGLDRIGDLLARRGERFTSRVFTPTEIRDCQRFARPVKHFALRFAAKEAALKAIGTGIAEGVHWKDVEVVSREEEAGSALALCFHGEAAARFAACGADRSHLALCATRSTASAFVVLEGPSLGGPSLGGELRGG